MDQQHCYLVKSDSKFKRTVGGLAGVARISVGGIFDSRVVATSLRLLSTATRRMEQVNHHHHPLPAHFLHLISKFSKEILRENNLNESTGRWIRVGVCETTVSRFQIKLPPLPKAERHAEKINKQNGQLHAGVKLNSVQFQ